MFVDVQMYAMGDEYGVNALKTTAARRFDKALNDVASKEA